MKIQMKFQKILTLVSLIIAALTFVFALSFLSGSGSNIQSYAEGQNAGTTFSGVDAFISASQSFVGALVVLSVIFILSVVLLMITSTNSRRKYYITNYVAIGIYAVMGIVIVFYILIEMVVLLGLFNAIDWDAAFAFYNDPESTLTVPPTQDTYMYTIGIVLSIVVLINVAAWALNFIWKLKLMKGEKALLEQGLVQEVA